jgi:hypothetical protein
MIVMQGEYHVKIKDIWNPKFKLLDAMPQALWLMYPTMEDWERIVTKKETRY